VALALRVAVRVALGFAELLLDALCDAEGERDGVADADGLALGDALPVSVAVDWSAAAAPAGEDEAAGRMVAAEPLLGPGPPLSPTMPTAATEMAATPTNISAFLRFFDRRARPGAWPDPDRDEPVRRA
jgi:hypothetical protein